MANSSAVIGITKKRPKFLYPKIFPVIDGIRYLPRTTREFLQDLKNLPVKGDEVFVVSYPKSGSTWVSEIVWQISKDGDIDTNPIHDRVPLLESLKRVGKVTTTEQLLEFFSNRPSPRVFKTHFQYPALAPMGDGMTSPKYINVIRNPKDTAVSYYHHMKSMELVEFDGEWSEYFEMFIDGEAIFGSWFDQVLGWWARRDDLNILTLKYEDLKKDLPCAVAQIATFLNRDLPEQTIQLIAKQTTFNAMSKFSHFHDDEKQNVYKRKPGASRFLRKGEVGDWKNYFTEEQNQRFDELYERKMAGSGLELDFS